VATITIKLLSHKEQTEFNLHRWDQLVGDSELAKIAGRVEMERFGRIILYPIASASHGSYQAEIGCLLQSLLRNGRIFIACPISTADGVRAADVAWASEDCITQLENRNCFLRSPEICVEVLSPGNSETEMQEKMALYFDAGAKEVWLCETSGAMKFFADGQSVLASKLCPDFPAHIQLS
jgi:Uma2 family endonuclease